MAAPIPVSETDGVGSTGRPVADAGRLRISAVAAGVVSDIGATFLFVILAGAVIGFGLGSSGVAPADVPARMDAIMAGVAWEWLACALGLAGTVTGGYVAGRMGRPASVKHALWMGGTSLVLSGLMMMGMTEEAAASMTSTLVGLVGVMPAAWLGGRLASTDD